MADIFLSHSSRDKALVRGIRDALQVAGFAVCLDLDVLPTIRPDEVTEATAEALRTAMRGCTALVYVISAQSRRSRWMPWELGFFDGCRGRVFVWPTDADAERYADGMQYLRIYPKVPLDDRIGFLQRHVQRTVECPPLAAPADAANPLAAFLAGLPQPGGLPLLFDYADQQNTAAYGARLQQAVRRMPADPFGWWQAAGEIGAAWLRLWGLVPPAERPGQAEGRWQAPG